MSRADNTYMFVYFRLDAYIGFWLGILSNVNRIVKR